MKTSPLPPVGLTFLEKRCIINYCSLQRFSHAQQPLPEDPVDTATVLTGEQQAVPEQPKPLEAVMFEEVRELYMATMKTTPNFRGELDPYWFRKHFATVAHKHGMIHCKGVLHPDAEQRENRNRYNLYFGLVQSSLKNWLRGYATRQRSTRMNSLRAASQPAAKSSERHGPVLGPTQLPLFGSNPPVSPPESFRRWLANRNNKK